MQTQSDIGSDTDIIKLCLNGRVLSCVRGGNTIVQISTDVVVKYGWNITKDEFANQAEAYRLLANTWLQVPRPYRFFRSADKGYLVMEYVPGRLLSGSDVECAHIIDQILSCLWRNQRDGLGPMSRGNVHGLLWSDYHTFHPTTTVDLQEHFNQRTQGPKLDLQGLPVVLCHLDLAARNIVVADDGTLTLLDWQSAGFYPRIFEICALRLNAKDGIMVNPELLNITRDLSGEEISQLQTLEMICSRKEAYVLGVKHFSPVISKSLRRTMRRKRKLRLQTIMKGNVN